MRTTQSYLTRILVLAATCLIANQSAEADLTFTTSFDSTVDSVAQTAITSALSVYGSTFSDNVNISLLFKNTGAGLGSSSTYSFTDTYNTYYNALVADGSTASDTTALASLTAGPNNPVNGTTMISQGRAGWASVGVNIDTSGIPNYFDGEIDLNLALMNYDRITIDPNKYDLQAVTQHEVNEVMGIISNVGNTNPRPIDLFRYDLARQSRIHDGWRRCLFFHRWWPDAACPIQSRFGG